MESEFSRNDLSKRRVAAIVALLLCSLVVAAPSLAKKKKLPKWVTNPPADTESVMYGIGEGPDLQSSKTAALAAIAGTLRTDVQSRKTQTQVFGGDEYAETFLAQIDTRVQETPLAHYRVVESAEVSKRWYTLVELSRTKLQADYRETLAENDAALSAATSRLSGGSALEQWLGRAELNSLARDAQSTLTMLRAVDPGFDGSDHAKRYLDLQDSMKRIEGDLRFFIDSDTLAQPFAQDLAELLGTENLHASLKKPASGHATVMLRSSAQDFDRVSTKTSTLTVLITTRDERGKELASLERTGTGNSISSHASARKMAARALTKDAEDEGVLDFLGLAQD